MKETNPFSFKFEDTTLYLIGYLVLINVDAFLPDLFKSVKKYYEPELNINLKELKLIDSAGVIALHLIIKAAAQSSLPRECYSQAAGCFRSSSEKHRSFFDKK